MIGQTISHYRILGLIAEGGMGVVYVAEDVRLGRRVAIKFPLTGTEEKNYRARFLREARAVSSITHRNIAAVYDYGETEAGQPYIVMELVTGRTLGELLMGDGISLARAVEIIVDVAAALAAAHRRGVVHRDIKPSNVLINEEGEVKVLDFGLAKQFDEERDPDAQSSATMQTRSDVIIGTPLYLSPEQARGGKLDGRSDLFTLGALLYECIAGRPAFSGANLIEIAAQVLHVDPPPPSKINPRVSTELDRIVLKALSKKPEERYQTAEEMSADLERARGRLSDSDTARTRRLATHPNILLSSALMTMERLRRPRLSALAFFSALVVVLFSVWAFAYLRRPTAHRPAPAALEAHERGVDAMRAGAYHRAKTEFERAVEIDGKFALAHARLAEAWAELDYLDRSKDELLTAGSLVPERKVLSPLDALYLDAVTTTARREFAEAVKAYEEIVRLSPDNPQAHFDLGRAHERNNKVEQAIESYVKVTMLDPLYAAAFLRLGILHGRGQDAASAIATFERAEQLYETQVNAEGRAEVFYQRGFFYRNRGKVAEARAQLEQALKLAESAGNQSQRINALLQLSAVGYAENDSARAERYAREAVETAQAHGMENLTARGLVDLGNVYFVRADYAEAEKYYQQALEYARRSKAKRAEALALINLGSLRIQQSRPDEAINYINQALDFYRQGNFRKEVSSGLLLLGRAKRMKGDYEDALRSFEEQLQLAGQSGDQSQAGLAHEGIGSILLIQERYPEALVQFQQKYAIDKSLGNQSGVGYGLAKRVSVLWRLGRYEEARELLAQVALMTNQSGGGNKELSVQIHVIRAEMALSQFQFAEAGTQVERALALAGSQYPDNLVEAKRVLGLAQAVSGARREGLRSCGEAVEMATRSNNAHLIEKTTLALAQAMLESGDAQGALTTALRAQEGFARHGQLISDWQAWAVATRASQLIGDQDKAREYVARASDSLTRIREQWGDEAYKIYLDRPDVRHYYGNLGLN